MTVDVASLLALADYRCCRCGEPGVTAFEDVAGLEAFLSPVPPLPADGAAHLMPRFGFARIDPWSLVQFGPVHRVCPRGRKAAKPCPYDLTKSVA